MEKNLLFKLLQTLCLTTFIVSFPVQLSGQEENLNVFDRWIEWTDGSHMLVHHLNKQAFAYLDQRDDEIAGLKTKEDWIKRQNKVRDILMNKIAGPFPQKTPLNAKVTGVVKKDGYKIEKIVFESQPSFYVTGALFIPEGKGKKPAILFTSGHSQDCFRYEPYQVMILNLVKKGFIVFAIDCLSQGERVQLYDDGKKASAIGPTTREHGYLGAQTLISGVSLARYFIWDGIRAIDYLLTRKEVDPARLGVSGQSGGGTQSAYIFACDERIKAGAPVNYITGFRRLLESIGPQDAEQNLYHGISNGITHADLLEVRAPDPSLIVAGTRDFFSIQGARETYAEVKNAHRILGSEENANMVEDDFAHGYTQKLREGIYVFFQKHLDNPGNAQDEEIKTLDPKELQISATGQVATSYANTANVTSINQAETRKLIDNLNASRKQIDQHIAKVKAGARELSGYIEPKPELRPVFRGRYQRNGYAVEMYALQGEGDYVIPLLLFVPGTGSRFSSIIYVQPKGKITDAAAGGQIEKLVKKGYVVAAPDLIGTGETAGSGSVAMLIGRSTAGVQAGDITRVVNFLKTRNDIDAGKIGGMAFETMAPVMLHAAALNNSINGIALIGSPVSYRSIVMNNFYNGGFANNAVAGALTAYDLPDLIGSLAPEKVALVDLKDQMNETANQQLTDEDLAFPKAAYARKGAAANLRIIPVSGDIVSIADWCFR